MKLDMLSDSCTVNLALNLDARGTSCIYLVIIFFCG